MNHRSRSLQRSKELCEPETAIMIHKARKAVRDMAARGISSSGPGMRTGMTMEGKTDRSRDSEVSKSALLYIPFGMYACDLPVAGLSVIRMTSAPA
ncbi:MAG: hypothetical protein IJ608_10670 [Lachnospiraceae bacterium]|nr:hypothetical protein [Lachnospiraceae bacterium]